MLKVDLLNLIPVFAQKQETPEQIQGEDPRAATEAIRKSCTERAESYEKWSQLIRQNCPIPYDHPYGALLKEHHIPVDDPLWTLGSIAFGTENAWIIFSSLHWPNGKIDLPEQMDLEWAKGQTSKAAP